MPEPMERHLRLNGMFCTLEVEPSVSSTRCANAWAQPAPRTAATRVRAALAPYWVDGERICSCLALAVQFDDREILSIEGLVEAEQSSWVLPAHHSRLAGPRRPHIDLMAASTALDLAELDALLCSHLDSAVGTRTGYEAEHRRFQPYLECADEWWWLSGPSAGTNRTAVCNAGVLGAAVYLVDDVDRLASMVQQGLTSLDLYLSSFDAAGGTSEGPNYWAYGFAACTLLAQLLEWRTGGQLRLLDDPRIGEIARYPLRTLLSPGRHVTFSDSRPTVRSNRRTLPFSANAMAYRS